MQRTARIALSFDDGRSDNYYAIKKVLIPNALHSTVYITTGYVDGTCEDEFRPTPKKAMTVEEVQELSREELVEIGLHGDKHLNEDWDILESWNKMLRWLSKPDTSRFGFASPSSQFPVNKLENWERGECPLSNYLSHIAVGPRFDHMHALRVFARKVSRVIPSGLIYSLAYSDTFLPPGNLVAVYRVPIMAGITAHQVITLIRLAVAKRANLVLMFHSIERLPDDNWGWSEKKFSQMCSFLKRMQDSQLARVVTVSEMLEQLKTDH